MQRHNIIQQAHYGLQIRRLVCHQYFVLGMTQTEIAQQHDHHPCQRTVSEIVMSYIEECNNVVVPPGNRGRRRSDRKFDMDAWDQLVRIIEEDEQFYLPEIASLLSLRTAKDFSEKDVCIALKESGYRLNAVHNRNPAGVPAAQSAGLMFPAACSECRG